MILDPKAESSFKFCGPVVYFSVDAKRSAAVEDRARLRLSRSTAREESG